MPVLILRSSVSADFSTTFPADENPISQSSIWQRGLTEGGSWNNPRTLSGRATAIVNSGLGSSRYDDTIAHLKTSYRTFAANQWAQGTVYRAGGYSPPGTDKHEVELYLRQAITSNNAIGYEIGWGISGNSGNAYLFVVRWNGPIGDFTAIIDPGDGSIPTPVNGDVLYAQIVGHIVTVKLNGSIVSGFGAVDVGTDYATGQPGMGFWPVDGSTAGSYGWDAYSAGDL